MQNKNTFIKLQEIRILMMVFLHFSATMVNITYRDFTLRKYYSLRPSFTGVIAFFIKTKENLIAATSSRKRHKSLRILR
jgi:hypothetical protein